MILCCTVLIRNSGDDARVHTDIFWTYGVIAKGGWRSRMLMSLIAVNILMMIPIGFLSPIVFPKWNWLRMLLAGICLSFSIEILQLMLRRGLFEFDDMIHNTAGVMAGFVLRKAAGAVFRRVKANAGGHSASADRQKT